MQARRSAKARREHPLKDTAGLACCLALLACCRQGCGASSHPTVAATTTATGLAYAQTAPANTDADTKLHLKPVGDEKQERKQIQATLKAQARASGGDAAATIDEAFRTQLREVSVQRDLVELLKPQDFRADVDFKAAQFLKGTRKTLCAAFDDFAKIKPSVSAGSRSAATPTPTPAATLEHADRVLFVSGGPGMGKSCWLAWVAVGYAQAQAQTQAQVRAPADLVLHLCSQARAASNSAANVAKTIVFQLCERIPAFNTWFQTQLDLPPPASASAEGGQKLSLRERLAKNEVLSARTFFKDYVVKGLCAVNAQALKAAKDVREAAAASAGEPVESAEDVETRAREAMESILPPCVSRKAGPGSAAAGASRLLILIDSVDQSGVADSGDVVDDDLVGLLGDAALLARLPTWVGLVLTGRPEDRIVRAMRLYKTYTMDA